MRSMPVRVVGSSLIALLVVGPATGRQAVANDAAPTIFQQAIRSWMGVVTLLAEDGEAASAERRDGETKRGDGERADRGHAMRAGREGRGPRAWSSDRGPGPRGQGWRMHAPPGMPPMQGPHGMGPGSAVRLDEIAERLARIERKLDAAPRMGNPWSPRPAAASRPGFAGPGYGRGREMSEEMRRDMEQRRAEMRKRMEEARARGGAAGRGERPQAPLAAMPSEVQERIKGMLEEGRRRMAEAQEKMEQARRRFAEMEERIKKLEAEVERLKAGK